MWSTTSPPTAGPHLSDVLDPLALRNLCTSWLTADMPSSFDVGGFVVGTEPRVAHLYMKQSGVFAGRAFFEECFNALPGCEVEWIQEDGEETPSYIPTAAVEGKSYTYSGKPLLLAVVRGPVHNVLRGERTALCALSRCSGVATASRRLVGIAEGLGWKGRVAGTRKTTPGFRLVEKFGLLCGGADTHRLDLSHMVMLKDNHVWAVGSIAEAVSRARRGCGFSSKIEVECRTYEEACEACDAGADVVMLDNYTPEGAKADAEKVSWRCSCAMR